MYAQMSLAMTMEAGRKSLERERKHHLVPSVPDHALEDGGEVEARLQDGEHEDQEGPAELLELHLVQPGLEGEHEREQGWMCISKELASRG